MNGILTTACALAFIGFVVPQEFSDMYYHHHPHLAAAVALDTNQQNTGYGPAVAPNQNDRYSAAYAPAAPPQSGGNNYGPAQDPNVYNGRDQASNGYRATWARTEDPATNNVYNGRDQQNADKIRVNYAPAVKQEQTPPPATPTAGIAYNEDGSINWDKSAVSRSGTRNRVAADIQQGQNYGQQQGSSGYSYPPGGQQGQGYDQQQGENYGQKQGVDYGQQQGQSYGQQQGQSYGQQQRQSYDQQQGQSYDQKKGQSYGQPGQNYGQEQGQSYGQQGQNYGQQQESQYGGNNQQSNNYPSSNRDNYGGYSGNNNGGNPTRNNAAKFAAGMRFAGAAPDDEYTYHGEGTFYDLETHVGTCGKQKKNTELAAALSHDLMGDAGRNDEFCGKEIEVVGPNGNSVQVTIVDNCKTCGNQSLDLSPAAFEELGDFSHGSIPIKWKFV